MADQGQGSQGAQVQPSPPVEQQQQNQHPAPPQLQPPPVPPLQSSSSGETSYRCQWVGCNEYHQSPEQLYEHVCDKHIGRKSTNNLNLQCAWGNCHVQVVKRDHITSHIRVHVPLKPHRCQFCGKTFKRPQDLKKHVKTHADDTVINGMNQPSQPGHQNHPQNGGYNLGNQHKAPGYYSEHHQMQPYAPPMGYGHQGQGGPQNYYAPTQQQGGPGPGGYGTVSYTVGHGEVVHGSFDSGKSFANLNSFIGDAQRNLIDLKNYSQVSNRLVPLQNAGVQYLLGGGMTDTQAPAHANTEGGGVYGLATAHYTLPSFDNLRTKDQLLDMARRFEQMASTVYDNADQVAAAGVGQPGAQYMDSTTSYRTSNSPPEVQLTSSHNESAMAAPSSQRSNHSSTPVLTPPSSAGGYTSGHSPDSTHSNPRLSPATPSGSVYPNLPGPSTNGYHANMASAATLSPNEHDYRPRHGGGYLQKAQPIRRDREDRMDTSEDSAATPKNTSPMTSNELHRAPVAPMQPKSKFLHSNIDPALSGVEPPSEEPAEKSTPTKPSSAADSAWVDSIRTLEALRKYITTRLENHEYEDSEGKDHSPPSENSGLYPTLKGVEVEG